MHLSNFSMLESDTDTFFDRRKSDTHLKLLKKKTNFRHNSGGVIVSVLSVYVNGTLLLFCDRHKTDYRTVYLTARKSHFAPA